MHTSHTEKRRSTGLAVAAWAGSTNLGDELCLSALLAKLAARGVRATVLSVDPAGTARDHGARAGTLATLISERRRRPDGVVLGGGGLLQDETSPFNLPFHLGRLRVAAGLGRPVAGIGLGAGPLTSRLGRRLVARALAPATGVSVRDQGSADVLARLGIRASLAADLAVSLPSPHVEVEGRIAVCLRPWRGGGGALPVSLRRRRGPETPLWFAPAMASSLDELAGRTGLRVHFVALQADRDDAVHQEVAALMATPSTSSSPDVHGVVAEVAGSEAVVAMRYHAGIAALLGGRPAVLLGYSPKVSSLALEVPGGMRGLAWEEASARAVVPAVEAVLGKGRSVIEGLEHLRLRERGNDQVLDGLLEAITA